MKIDLCTQTDNVRLLDKTLAFLYVAVMFVVVAIGLVYYFKIDPFLPPAMSLVLIPLIIQLNAAHRYKQQIQKTQKMKARVEGLEKAQKEGVVEVLDPPSV